MIVDILEEGGRVHKIQLLRSVGALKRALSPDLDELKRVNHRWWNFFGSSISLGK